MRKTLLLSSLVVIAVLAAVAYRENLNMDWQRYQKKYKYELQRLAKTEQEKKTADNYDIRMRQIVLPELGRADRCVTCHVAMEDFRMSDMPHPLKSHPGDYLDKHDVNMVGCTLCHDGQGRAITTEDAHAQAEHKYWEEPILEAPFLQSNCSRCHVNQLEQTPHFNRGKQMFEDWGCTGCHKVDGKGGLQGPDLTAIGVASFHVKAPTYEKRAELLEKYKHNINLAYLYESLMAPQAQPSNSTMPDFGFSEEEATDLIVYLKSLSGKRRIMDIGYDKVIKQAAGVVPEPAPVVEEAPKEEAPATEEAPAPAEEPAVEETQDAAESVPAEKAPAAPEAEKPEAVEEPAEAAPESSQGTSSAEFDLVKKGYDIFNTRCIACHTIGQGKRVGPDLKGVVSRRNRDWLKKFIQVPSIMFAEKDPIAMKLLEEYKTPMTDLSLTDEDVEEVLKYMENPLSPPKTAESASTIASRQATTADVERQATKSDIAKGKDLFQGKIRLLHGGPSCISCHHVKNDAIIGGGILAKDLTTVFSRMGGVGVHAVIDSPPFPIMELAYKDMPLTEDEIFAIVSFLEEADKQHAYQQPSDYGIRLFGSGVAGMVLLMGFYSIFWNRRKKDPVNKDIFDRQIKSE